MSHFYDRFQPDPEFPESRRVWETEKPLLKDAVAEFAPYDPDYRTYPIGKGKPYPLEPSDASARVASDTVGVFLFEWSDEAAPLQQAGWEYLVANAAAVEAALIQKLQAMQAKCLEMHEEELEGADFLQKHWKEIEAGLRSPVGEAVDQFYKLVGISLGATGLDECCFVGFEFQSGWDQDHGLGIAMHKDRVLAAGGMTELLTPIGSTVERIKATQKYELDPGDYRLP